jgi:hypothetical protein
MSLITSVVREAEAIINVLRPEELKYILYFVIKAFNEYKNIFLFISLLLILTIFIINYFGRNK